jgi:hypothetical protein
VELRDKSPTTNASKKHPIAMARQMIASFFFVVESAGFGLPLFARPYAAPAPTSAVIMK